MDELEDSDFMCPHVCCTNPWRAHEHEPHPDHCTECQAIAAEFEHARTR